MSASAAGLEFRVAGRGIGLTVRVGQDPGGRGSGIGLGSVGAVDRGIESLGPEQGTRCLDPNPDPWLSDPDPDPLTPGS